MNTRLRVAALLAVSAAIALVVGLYLGMREGMKISANVDALARGNLAVRALGGLEKGNADTAKLILELQVDQGLLSANELTNASNHPVIEFVFTPDIDSANTEKWTTSLASYRKHNPSPFQGQFLTHDPGETPEQRKLIDEALDNHRERDRIFAQLIARYAKE